MSEVKQMMALLGVALLLLPLIVFMVFGNVSMGAGDMQLMSWRSILDTVVSISEARFGGSLQALYDIWTKQEGTIELMVGFDSYIIDEEHYGFTPNIISVPFNTVVIDFFDGKWDLLDSINPLNVAIGGFQRICLTLLIPINATVSPLLDLPFVILECLQPIDEVLGIPEGGIWGDDLPPSVNPDYVEEVIG